MEKSVYEYVNDIKPYVIELFKNDFSGHDIGHLERTMKVALFIQSQEGGDAVVIGIAAFLHDIHRIMQNESGKFVSPKDSLPKVREILSHTDLTEKQIDKICYCIEYHEEYNWNGDNVTDLDALILQDADNMDAIGVIGIGRAFIYGGAHNIAMYDENIPLNSNSDYKEHSGDNETTIHHMYHKLFKLGDNMNTKTGRLLAGKRIKYMKKVTKFFLDEWKGNYLETENVLKKKKIQN